ncbi:MAG TPA: hypothetical protein P5148_17925, partial [Anaerolineae bacterium]|nr:hypothetical protein [Anaerolineae bacterium]
MKQDDKPAGPASAAEHPAADAAKPQYVADLETVFGPPSQAAFGSAVFNQALDAGAGLETAALGKYKYFVGDLWERYGEDAWMGPWKEVYARPAGATA